MLIRIFHRTHQLLLPLLIFEVCLPSTVGSPVHRQGHFRLKTLMWWHMYEWCTLWWFSGQRYISSQFPRSRHLFPGSITASSSHVSDMVGIKVHVPLLFLQQEVFFRIQIDPSFFFKHLVLYHFWFKKTSIFQHLVLLAQKNDRLDSLDLNHFVVVSKWHTRVEPMNASSVVHRNAQEDAPNKSFFFFFFFFFFSVNILMFFSWFLLNIFGSIDVFPDLCSNV